MKSGIRIAPDKAIEPKKLGMGTPRSWAIERTKKLHALLIQKLATGKTTRPELTFDSNVPTPAPR